MKLNVPSLVINTLAAAEAQLNTILSTQSALVAKDNKGVNFQDMSDLQIAQQMLSLKDHLRLPKADLVIDILPANVPAKANDVMQPGDKFISTFSISGVVVKNGKVAFLWRPEIPALDVDVDGPDYVGESVVKGVSTYWFFHQQNEEAFSLLSVTGTTVRLNTYLYNDMTANVRHSSEYAPPEYLVNLVLSQMAAAVALSLMNYNKLDRGLV